MAKRFTDTDKWKKPFIKSLAPEYKLLWFYITDDCDHAGIWNVDLEVASFRIGYDFKIEEVEKVFAGKIVPFDNNSKWFLPSFIEFQYGELSEKNRAHESVLRQLNKYGLIENKVLKTTLQEAKDKDKDKDKEQDKDKDFGKPENLLKPKPLQTSIVGEMQAAWKEVYPDAFIDECDPANLFEIAGKIHEWQKLPGRPLDNREQILLRWGEIANHCRADSHLSKYSIQQVNKHFSSVIQSLKNGNTTKHSQSGNPKGGKHTTAVVIKPDKTFTGSL